MGDSLIYEVSNISNLIVLSCLERKHKAACVTCQFEINNSAVVRTYIRAGEGRRKQSPGARALFISNSKTSPATTQDSFHWFVWTLPRAMAFQGMNKRKIIKP